MSDNLRRVRSYVIRNARMSDAQRKAYDELSPGRVLDYREELIDWDDTFGPVDKRIVEIGFGMGDATRQLAENYPAWGILGIEVHRPGVGKLLWWIQEKGLGNIRIVEHDAVEVMEQMVPPGSVDGFHIWFPDPWPKKRHHKRRLIQSEFLESLVTCLKEGGYIHAATDWEPYAEHILNVMDDNKDLVNTSEKWSSRPEYRPDTKFENKGIAADRTIRDIIFTKEPS